MDDEVNALAISRLERSHRYRQQRGGCSAEVGDEEDTSWSLTNRSDDGDGGSTNSSPLDRGVGTGVGRSGGGGGDTFGEGERGLDRSGGTVLNSAYGASASSPALTVAQKRSLRRASFAAVSAVAPGTTTVLPTVQLLMNSSDSTHPSPSNAFFRFVTSDTASTTKGFGNSEEKERTSRTIGISNQQEGDGARLSLRSTQPKQKHLVKTYHKLPAIN